jgi:hypothetical protein
LVHGLPSVVRARVRARHSRCARQEITIDQREARERLRLRFDPTIGCQRNSTPACRDKACG